MTAFNPYTISVATDDRTTLRSLVEHNRRPLLGTNYIAGGVPSNAADAANDISFTAGACTSQNGYLMPIPAYTKQLDVAFALGTGVGGLATGAVSNTTYHAFALFAPTRNVSDIGFDTSLTAANLFANSIVSGAKMTEYRRIFSFYRAAGANVLFTARESSGGVDVTLAAPAQDVSRANPGVNSVAETLSSVPSGFALEAKGIAFLYDNTNTARANELLVTELTQTDTEPSGSIFTARLLVSLLATGQSVASANIRRWIAGGVRHHCLLDCLLSCRSTRTGLTAVRAVSVLCKTPDDDSRASLVIPSSRTVRTRHGVVVHAPKAKVQDHPFRYPHGPVLPASRSVGHWLGLSSYLNEGGVLSRFFALRSS